MQEKDILSKEYLSVNERFADAVNVGMFQGKQVISPAQLKEITPVSSLVVENSGKHQIEAAQQYRDILKTVVYDTNFCIVGIENQSEIHYAFPVRNLLYDAAAYKKQWDSIKKEHRKKKDLESRHEFLSGFSKNDRLQGVVTLVVYFGTEHWDGAMELHDLVDWRNIPEEIKEIVPNYSVHVLELNRYKNPEDFRSDLKTVCRFIQNSTDKEKLKQMLKEHREEFENMEEDTYQLIGTLGNMEPVKRLKEEYRNEKGGYNMCKGMDEWLDEKLEEGMEKGIEKGIDCVNQLFSCLVADGRLEDLKRSTEDREYQKKLMKEYSI